jgi:hypothetical protein
MSFFKKLVYPAAPDTNASAGLLKSNEDAHITPADPPTDELFSTVGDYGLQTLSENPDNIVE